MMTTIGVLALQGDVSVHLRMLSACGARAVAVRRTQEILAVDGLVIPGGESTTMIKLVVNFELFEPLRKRITEGVPTFGTCAGMIMLADRIEDGVDGQHGIGGMDMVVRRNAFGRQVDSFETDLDLAAMDDDRRPYHAVFIRAPQVDRVGPTCRVLARVPGGPRDVESRDRPEAVTGGAIVAVRQGHLLATAFHPELTGDLRIHDHFVRIVKEG